MYKRGTNRGMRCQSTRKCGTESVFVRFIRGSKRARSTVGFYSKLTDQQLEYILVSALTRNTHLKPNHPTKVRVEGAVT